jgi:FKBP-type peptidyl-prolyl cis-trans isomerase 2
MSVVNESSKVKVHYVGKFTDGQVFDASKAVEGNEVFSETKDPIEVELGKGLLIPGFEKGLQGMSKGEVKTITIESKDAYGDVQEERVQDVPKESIKDIESIEVGQSLRAENDQGQDMVVTIKSINEDTVTLDANHPFAGKDLVFEIEVVEII